MRKWSSPVAAKYQVDAEVISESGKKMSLSREIIAPDGHTVWKWLLDLVVRVGGRLLSQQIRRINTETGELKDVRILTPPFEEEVAAQKWYELVAFGTVDVTVTTSPCTYKEDGDDKATT